MPPETPTMIRLRSLTWGPALLLALGVFEQVGVDLTHRDGQRLFLQPRLDQRADVFEDALAELVVVIVDLTGTLGRVDHQGVLAGHPREQLVDGRVGDAQRRVVSADTTRRGIELVGDGSWRSVGM